MKKQGALIILALLSIQIWGQTYTYPIVDTDVNEFYSDNAIISEPGDGDAFYGQDASYYGNQPSYTDNEDGTVNDNVTGLMWQKDPGEKMSYADAVELVKTMTLGDFSDWRIPSIKELYSLAYFSGRCMGENAIDLFIDTSYFVQPIGDVSLGEREIDGQTWTKNHYVGLTMRGDTAIFGFNFVDGRLKGYPKYKPRDKSDNKMFFRMVRGNVSYGINNFKDNGDGTITDHATGLMWQKADDGNNYNWEEGLAYAENLNLADYDDWRMPNAKELHSIVDYSRSPSTSSSPAIDPLFFCTEIRDPDGNSGQYGYYWSSSPLQDGPNPYSDAVYICFGKAQGQMESPPNSGNFVILDVHGAGAQRNDPKSGNSEDYPDYHGPQGDVRYVYNFIRCVRDISSSTSVDIPAIQDQIKLYPNPADSEIKIKLYELCSELSIDIVNVLGTRIQSFKLNNVNECLLNISLLEKGYYFVQINKDKQIITKKLLVI